MVAGFGGCAAACGAAGCCAGAAGVAAGFFSISEVFCLEGGFSLLSSTIGLSAGLLQM